MEEFVNEERCANTFFSRVEWIRYERWLSSSTVMKIRYENENENENREEEEEENGRPIGETSEKKS